MGTFKHVIDRTGAPVVDICRVKNVVDGVVTATPMGLVRTLYKKARYLLSRLASWLGTGLQTLEAFAARPASPATMWAHQPASMAGAHSRRLGRRGRPWSAFGSARF